MVMQLVRNWWVLALRGLLGVLFGLAAFVWPGLTLAALVLLYGAYALVDGVFAVFTALAYAGKTERWWVVLLQGIIGIAAGLVTFAWPSITALALIYLIAAWAIVTGVLEIAAAVRLRKEISAEWMLGLSGALSVLLGLLIMARPGAGALAFVWLLASYAIVYGVLLIALAFRLRTYGRSLQTHVPA